MTIARIQTLEKPYPENIEAILANYPQGPEGPIALFRTLAHSERALTKLGASGLLDKASPIKMKDREIVILRTSARCNCEYEWGVHVQAFSNYVGLSEAQIGATVHGLADNELWNKQEQILIRFVDELVDSKKISDDLWRELVTSYNKEQIIELIMLVGFYHNIAFLNNVLQIPNEPGAPTFA